MTATDDAPRVGPDHDASRVCVGQIVGVHGVRGSVKLKSFTADPADVAAYGPLSDEAGTRRFQPVLTGEAKGVFIARLDGVADRDAAEALKGVRLFAPRSALPEPDDAEEFYYADLIGLRAETADGEAFGKVTAVHDFGAGDILELRKTDGRTVYLPFTRTVFPVVDVRDGRVVVAPPDEIDVRDAAALEAEAVEGESG